MAVAIAFLGNKRKLYAGVIDKITSFVLLSQRESFVIMRFFKVQVSTFFNVSKDADSKKNDPHSSDLCQNRTDKILCPVVHPFVPILSFQQFKNS